MTRMIKLALAALVAIALVAGFTSTSATAASVRAAAGQGAERANECGQQQARVAQTQRNATIKKAQLAKAGKVLKQATKRLQKAKRSGQLALIKDARKGVKRAKTNKALKTRNLKKARNLVAVAAQQLRACQQAGDGGGGATGPLQPACDAGLPQAVCDALDGLPLPGGVVGATSPIQMLCDAGLPQAICDAAATGVPSLPGADNPIQALCDAGLPQGICDLANGQVGVDTLPIPGGLPGLPDFPGVPEFSGLDTLLALLAPITGQLPLGTVCATLDIPVVCDLVG